VGRPDLGGARPAWRRRRQRPVGDRERPALSKGHPIGPIPS
jgi:hypothetical protein